MGRPANKDQVSRNKVMDEGKENRGKKNSLNLINKAKQKRRGCPEAESEAMREESIKRKRRKTY